MKKKTRNGGHRDRQAARYAQAEDPAARFWAAADWYRASAALLARRRPPQGVPQALQEHAARRLLEEMAETLKTAAETIDAGGHDTRKAAAT